MGSDGWQALRCRGSSVLVLLSSSSHVLAANCTIDYQKITGTSTPAVRLTNEAPRLHSRYMMEGHGLFLWIEACSFSGITYNALSRQLVTTLTAPLMRFRSAHTSTGPLQWSRQITSFSEKRSFSGSGCSYNIQVAGVSYDGFGDVVDFSSR